MTDTIFQPGEYVTRDGKKARVYATDGGEPWALHGAIMSKDGWCLCAWRGNGASSWSNAADLMPPKQVRYVNVYRDGVMDSTFAYPCRATADLHAGHERIACIRIEFTEGQYDD